MDEAAAEYAPRHRLMLHDGAVAAVDDVVVLRVVEQDADDGGFRDERVDPVGNAAVFLRLEHRVEKARPVVVVRREQAAALDPLRQVHPEIDMVTTPSGAPVAMVHCNNCTSDLNAWVSLFGQALQAFGVTPDSNDLYGTLYRKALEGDPDCGGLLAYNYFSGEHVTGFKEGRPLFVRRPDSRFTLANFMRVHLYTSLGALKTGMDILMNEENVSLENITGHGGLFKTEGVGQRIVAAAMHTPVTCMETAGEGGPWGMALLACYMMQRTAGESLEDYLSNRVFQICQSTTMQPDETDIKGFDAFMNRYAKGLSIEKAAIEAL